MTNKNGKCKGLDKGYRDCSPSRYLKEYRKCKKDHVCKGKVRVGFQTFERGRYYSGVDKLHHFAGALDPDELKNFKKEFPSMTKAINQFAEMEDLKKI